MLAKQMHTLLIGMAIHTIGLAQETTLRASENELIYNQVTMARLKQIADSLHLKYNNAQPVTTYYSMKQATGHQVTLDTGDIKAALRDIQNGITWQAFIEKHPLAKTDTNNLILETPGEGNQQAYLSYKNITTDSYYTPIEISAACIGTTESNYFGLCGKIGSWIFDYNEPDRNHTGDITAIYLLSPPVKRPIPESCTRHILYTDYLVDTNTNIFLDGARYDGFLPRPPEGEKIKTGPKHDRLMKYVEQQASEVIQRAYLAHKEEEGRFEPENITLAYVHDSLSKQPLFRQLLADAVSEAQQEKYMTDGIFEYYTEFHSKEIALAMMRNRIVSGSCGNDPSFIYHILNISHVAAEVTNWPVFIRAHLTIMNEFKEGDQRSPLAKQKRMTYTSELEELGIDVASLLLGATLRTSNSAINHYTASIVRRGRPFAEITNKAAFEKKLLAMITDDQLDDYNRYLLQHVLFDYVYYLPEKADRQHGYQLLVTAAQSLPTYMRKKLAPDQHKQTIETGFQAIRHPYTALSEIGFLLLLLHYN